jgi:hypothetical protein
MSEKPCPNVWRFWDLSKWEFANPKSYSTKLRLPRNQKVKPRACSPSPWLSISQKYRDDLFTIRMLRLRLKPGADVVLDNRWVSLFHSCNDNFK